MKPGHIKVFDGMRITTEHMNHLQGSFHSALQDFRQIMGLGKVYYGFEVIKENHQAITVTPGLAFDLQKNRITCEEPTTLTIQWNPGEENEKYVGIKYKQVEDGIVEDEPTLIWDNCETAIYQQFPAPGENVITVAKLTPPKNREEGFEIVSLIPGYQDEESRESEENGDRSRAQINGGEKEKEEDSKTGIIEPAEEEASGELPQEETGEDREIEANLPGPGNLKLNIRQGVERLPQEAEEGVDLGTLVLEPLKKKLNSKVNTSGEELLFPLAEKEVTLDTPVCSLNCHTIINVDVNIKNSSSKKGEESNNINQPLRIQSTAQGEVTITGEQVLQFGVSTVRYYPAAPGGNPWSFSDLTQDGIAHLPLEVDGLSKFPGSENIAGDMELLENVQFLVKVKAVETPGFKIICCLKWKGEITGEIIKKFKQKKISVAWQVLYAWKSLEKYFDQ